MNAKTTKANPTELQVTKTNKERLNDARLWIRSIEMTRYRCMNRLDWTVQVTVNVSQPQVGNSEMSFMEGRTGFCLIVCKEWE